MLLKNMVLEKDFERRKAEAFYKGIPRNRKYPCRFAIGDLVDYYGVSLKTNEGVLSSISGLAPSSSLAMTYIINTQTHKCRMEVHSQIEEKFSIYEDLNPIDLSIFNNYETAVNFMMEEYKTILKRVISIYEKKTTLSGGEHHFARSLKVSLLYMTNPSQYDYYLERWE
ncbi:hypothetical protein V7114_19495 [Neobacillus niacini]|uniref:hypothetical protein n=1 Tax=Neobacillus niacini TaxID=86668 RepID=UPI002FFF2B65